jgi:3-oxoacyl-[acyl-carrier protein] reductase
MAGFEGKGILITGGAMGIGAATAKRLARDGAQVIIADIDQESAERVVAEIAGSGGKASYQYVDLADSRSIEEMALQTAAKVRQLHGLVNNAGIVRHADLEGTGEDDWEPQVSINLRAPAICIKALLPLLKKGPGHIVNLSSEGAFTAKKGRWVYDATKAGICALTRDAAEELAEYGIRVNAVAPGWVVTEMHFKTHEDPVKRKEELESMVFDKAMINRLARPREIASVIAFLLSDDASYITAHTIHVDGGLTAR